MTSNGELVFKQTIVKLARKASTRFITGYDTQSIGRFFWPFMTNEYKADLKAEQGRQAFWFFAQSIKFCLVNNQLEIILELWTHFDQNGKNLFENLYENCLNNLICEVL
jgi:hypothetical protein